MNTIKPEICYDYTPLTLDEVKHAHDRGETITGIVESISAETKEIMVKLGKDIMAKIPFDEATIYPLRYSKNAQSSIPSNIYFLLHHKIRAKVTSITQDDIILSRKKNMEEALHEVKKLPVAKMHITDIIPKTAFGDIGEGITGKLFINDVCMCHIRSVRDYFKRGQIIDVAVMNCDSDNQFAVSYKQTFDPYKKEDYKVGEQLICKVGDYIQVAATSKYYANVTPQVRGILFIDQRVHLNYGSEVNCVVTGATDKGLYLELA